MRRKAKAVKVGNVVIGGGAPVSIQTMTVSKTADIDSTADEIIMLQNAGADIVRLAVPDIESAQAFGQIKKRVSVPLVADIHFDYKIALLCIDGGADKIRINPGNIGSHDRVKAVAKAALSVGIPIRIGVNMGSISDVIFEKFGNTPRAMVESAKEHALLLENEGFHDIVLSLKASDVRKTVEAYRMMAEECEYPLHIGVTEAGTAYSGIIKSAVGIGSLILDGIADTIRVSLTAPPEEEIKSAKTLLQALGERQGPEIISCPTCGRCRIDLIDLARKVEQEITGINKPLKVAVMGCAVNGPGEARHADIGVAGGDGKGLIFRHGEIIKSVPENEILPALMSEIRKITGEV